MSPSGTPVNPDGGYVNPDGSHDWMPGYGPQMSFGGQEIRTGRAPTAPDPGSGDALGAARGTPQYRQAEAAHQAWIKSQLDSGLHLADLGLTPTRGGGLSSYMQFGGYQPSGGGAASASPAPAAPGAPPVAGSGGYLGAPGQAQQMSYGGSTNPLQAAIMQLLGQSQGQ